MLKKIYKGKIDSESLSISRESRPSTEINALRWLQSQTEYPQILWVSKNRKSWVAAAGSCLNFYKIPEIEGFSDLAFFVGGSEHEEKSPWGAFPEIHFLLPKNVLRFQRGKAQEETYFAPFLPSYPKTYPSSRASYMGETPDRATWDKTIAKALEQIENKNLSKVVTARAKHVQKKGDLFAILQKMLSSSGRHIVFLYRPSSESAFLGMTPEMLFEKKGRKITTEAIAATRRRLSCISENRQEEEALHKDPKDLLEFSIVKDTLDQLLSPYCDFRKWLSQDKVLKTPTLLHLYNRLEAHLNQTMSPKALLELLHPTPSITGFPKKKAAAFLKNHEPFARGWYAAPIGWIGSKNAELAVAIRSLLLREGTTTFFSATGIVKGSIAQKEWQELNDKIAFLEGIL